MSTISKLIAPGLALLLTPGLLHADPWQDDLRERRGYAEEFREDRDDDDEEREDRTEALEELREEREERLEELREEQRERAEEWAEEWRERHGWRAPLYGPQPRNQIYIPPRPRYEIQPRYDRGHERYEGHRERRFFVPPPPAPDSQDQRHGAYYGPRREDDDDDIDAVYTPFGYYEELPESDDRHGRRPHAHGQVGPFRFEIWK